MPGANRGKPVLVTGGSGLVGGAVVRQLKESGFEVLAPTRSEMDLLDDDSVRQFFSDSAVSTVVAAAAVVGGIAANIAEPVRFLVENLTMQNNLMTAAADSGVAHLVFMSSSCVYPRACRQPMRESDMMTGPLEPTNESYAVAKLAGTQLARALGQEARMRTTVLVPSNIYGPGDSFDPARAHVASALVKKFVDARRADQSDVIVWGTGKARRELTHVRDLAASTEFVLRRDDLPFMLNVGTGEDHTIAELAQMIARLAGFEGTVTFDTSRPDGMPRKVLDVSVLASLGWRAQVGLEEGLSELIQEYEAHSRNDDRSDRTRGWHT